MNNASNTLKELNELRVKLETQLESIKETIRIYELHSELILINHSSFHGNDDSSIKLANVPQNNDYNKNASFKHKIAYVLSKANKFLSMKEIADMVSTLEPETDPEQIKRGLGSAKSVLLKEKKIVKYVVGKSNNNSFYGRSIWLDVTGDPLEEHGINEGALVKKQEDELF